MRIRLPKGLIQFDEGNRRAVWAGMRMVVAASSNSCRPDGHKQQKVHERGRVFYGSRSSWVNAAAQVHEFTSFDQQFGGVFASGLRAVAGPYHHGARRI